MSSLLGICTIVISFFVHVFSVFMSLSLCHYADCSRRSMGFGVTRSHLIYIEVNITISVLQMRKAEVQRCHVTCFGMVLSKLSLYLIFPCLVIVVTFQSYCED